MNQRAALKEVGKLSELEEGEQQIRFGFEAVSEVSSQCLKDFSLSFPPSPIPAGQTSTHAHDSCNVSEGSLCETSFDNERCEIVLHGKTSSSLSNFSPLLISELHRFL